MATSIGSYKGSPTLSLNSETKYPFTFGVSKAKAILANLDAIKAFVARYDAPRGGDPVDKAYEDRCAEQCGMTQPGM